jgi:hypothetical protein
MNQVEFKKVINAIANSKINYAVSGSWAMKLHANKAGVKSRAPHNINIVVGPGNNRSVASVLASLGYMFNGPPTYGKNIITLYKNGKEIDILRAGGGLAPTLNNINNINGIPVLTVNQLLRKKNNVMNNYNILKSPNKRKVKNNMNILTTIKKKNPTTSKKARFFSPIKTAFVFGTPTSANRNMFRSPNSSSKHKINFGTPSPVKGRKLF